MIFVTVGLHTQGFDRLIKKMDDIASEIDEKVIMQIGSSRYEPRHATYFRVTDEKELASCYESARVIVCHGGAGTLIKSLLLKKPIIVVPRLKKFGEHIDNHQLELAEVLSKSGYISLVNDLEELREALFKIKFCGSNLKSNQKFIHALKCHIDNMITDYSF